MIRPLDTHKGVIVNYETCRGFTQGVLGLVLKRSCLRERDLWRILDSVVTRSDPGNGCDVPRAFTSQNGLQLIVRVSKPTFLIR